MAVVGRFACGGVVLCLALVLGVTARASAPDPLFDDSEDALHFPDPLEPLNRATFVLNRGIDRLLIDPLSRTYRALVADDARRAIRMFFRNLNSPSIVVNDVLQREWRAAAIGAARTGINTTIGLAGFFDPATHLGLPYQHADFGQTLALAGMPSGPYLVIPFLGPTDARDGVGALVDFAFRPTTYLFGSVLLGGLPGVNDQFLYSSIQGSSTGLVTRAAAQRELTALRETSVDFYATLRTAYYQARLADIWRDREHHKALQRHARFIRQCRSSGPRFSRANRRRVLRILPASQRRCNPSDVAPAR